MVLPGFVKDHPVISVVLFLSVIGVLGFTASIYSQATLVDDQNCGTWEPAVNPESESEELFESKDAFRSYFEENDAVMPNGSELRYNNGELQFKAPCGKVGGDTSS